MKIKLFLVVVKTFQSKKYIISEGDFMLFMIKYNLMATVYKNYAWCACKLLIYQLENKNRLYRRLLF